MKLFSLQVLFPAVSAAALLLLVSCASEPEDEQTSSTVYRHGVPGGSWIESAKVPVTVAAVDPAKRTVTLVASDNSRTTYTAGSDFSGFDQLRIGEQFQAVVATEWVVFLRQHGLPPRADTAGAKELINDGEHSGVLKTDTAEKTGKVTAINHNQGQVTLQFTDGTTQNVAVRRDVNLWSFKPGEEVVIRTRSAAVLNLEKP